MNTSGTTTILGAGGPVADDLARILLAANTPVRLVSRSPKPIGNAEILPADISDPDQAIRAIAGSSTVHLLVGLKYDLKVWQDLWPRIMANTIEACKRANARLVFFDNVYMYGKVSGPMTEDTPYAPTSRKGEIRARIATTLMDEVHSGGLTALIARAADFYGPRNKHSVPNILVFEPLSANSTPSWLVNPDVPHSFTFIPDAARGLAMLTATESAWNQVWHLPTAPSPLTGRQFIELAAREFNRPPKFRVLSRPILKLVGLFNSDIRESYEMLYQNDSPYLFDSTKFARAFNFPGTPYPEGMHLAAASYK
ncbi:MAG TPA: NAD-dependent epimerase/dehydratase family protein [Bryobacteraceae bacterium]